MNIYLRIFSIAAGLLVVIGIARMLIRHRINESNSVFWLGLGAVALLSGLFPGLLGGAAWLLGLEPPAFLLLVSGGILLLIALKSSSISSKTEAKMTEIAILLSIEREESKRLAKRVVELETRTGERGEITL